MVKPKVAKVKVCQKCEQEYKPTSNRQQWCPPCLPPKSVRAKKHCKNPDCNNLTWNGKNCPKCAARFYNYGAYELPWREHKVTTSPEGYSRVRVGKDHPMANSNGLAYVHRLVMSEVIGRPLLVEETVHHKNGIKHDNRPENLELWAKNHGAGQRVKDLVRFVVEHYRDLVEEEMRKTTSPSGA